MKRSCLGIISLFILVMSTAVQASEHTGYWNERTQAGEEFGCEGADTRERMVEVLRRAGWNVSEGVPKINWQSDEAVIVAPSKYYKSGLLAFYGLQREGNAIVLAYGWDPIQGSESVGASSATFGSVGEGYPATLVVAHRRGLDSGLSFKCRNKGLRQ